MIVTISIALTLANVQYIINYVLIILDLYFGGIIMELLQLQYFLLLAKEQHVTKTAELLHISQPSLSATIKKLQWRIWLS